MYNKEWDGVLYQHPIWTTKMERLNSDPSYWASCIHYGTYADSLEQEDQWYTSPKPPAQEHFGAASKAASSSASTPSEVSQAGPGFQQLMAASWLASPEQQFSKGNRDNSRKGGAKGKERGNSSKGKGKPQEPPSKRYKGSKGQY